jgi:hypothetical protein
MKELLDKDSNGKMKLKPDVYDSRLNQANETLANTALSTPEQQANAALQKRFLETIGKDDKK